MCRAGVVTKSCSLEGHHPHRGPVVEQVWIGWCTRETIRRHRSPSHRLLAVLPIMAQCPSGRDRTQPGSAATTPVVRHCRTQRYGPAVPGSVQSVERAAAILRLLAEEDEPIGLAQITSALGLAKGTVHGILRTLEDVGFVEQDQAGGPYRVATEVFRLGWTEAGSERTAVQGAELDRRSGRPDRRVRQGGRLSRGPGRSRAPRLPGRRRHPGAGDRLGGPAARERARQGAAGVRPRRGAQHREPTAARADHPDHHRSASSCSASSPRSATWAGRDRSARSNPGVAGIAAPIRDRGGYVVAVVGIEGSVERLCDDRRRPRPALVSHVVRAGRSISRELGHGRDL